MQMMTQEDREAFRHMLLVTAAIVVVLLIVGCYR